MSLSWLVGLRYTFAKRRNHFISFMSMTSMMGIILGITVLITVLSVMNGFDQQIRERILSMVPQVTVSAWGGQIENWPQWSKALTQQPHVVNAAPFIQGQGMLSHAGAVSFAMLQGINPVAESKVLPLASKMIKGHLSNLKPGSFGIILGRDLADNLGVNVGDKIMVYVPKATLSPMGMLPRMKAFKVVGLFNVSYEYDSMYALINIKDAATLLKMGNAVTGLQLKLTDLFLAPEVVYQLRSKMPAGYQVLDWTEQNANFFKALKMEKLMMFLILTLIIAVAAFNMLSSLVMLVNDKRSDIAILRTIGASTKSIMGIFLVQGCVIGILGTVLGDILGLLLADNVTALVNGIQHLFHVQFLSASVYYISFVPSKIDGMDVVMVSCIAVLLSFIATLYPAFKASRVQPAEALRDE